MSLLEVLLDDWVMVAATGDIYDVSSRRGWGKVLGRMDDVGDCVWTRSGGRIFWADNCVWLLAEILVDLVEKGELRVGVLGLISGSGSQLHSLMGLREEGSSFKAGIGASGGGLWSLRDQACKLASQHLEDIWLSGLSLSLLPVRLDQFGKEEDWISRISSISWRSGSAGTIVSGTAANMWWR